MEISKLIEQSTNSNISSSQPNALSLKQPVIQTSSVNATFRYHPQNCPQSLASNALIPAKPKPQKRRNIKWTPKEDATMIELRRNGVKWEDIAKQLPGRSALSCRLRYQNYSDKRPQWDEKKKNKLAHLYSSHKAEMWEMIASELGLPWRAVEAMHWQMGAEGIAACTKDGSVPDRQDGAMEAEPEDNMYGTRVAL